MRPLSLFQSSAPSLPCSAVISSFSRSVTCCLVLVISLPPSCVSVVSICVCRRLIVWYNECTFCFYFLSWCLGLSCIEESWLALWSLNFVSVIFNNLVHTS
jgi:hypothetical protein